MRLDAAGNHKPKRAEHVIVVLAGDLLVEFRRPILAGLRGDFIEAQFPKLRPGPFQFQNTAETISLAAGFYCRIALQLSFEKLHRLFEFRRINLVPVFPALLEKIIQPQLRG